LQVAYRCGLRALRVPLVPVVVAGVVTLGACGSPGTLSARDDRVQVVTTTSILRDLVANVGGDRVNVVSLVPDGADPHSFEPSLRSIRNVVYADVAFSNYALLEEQRIIRAIDANLPPGRPNVALAEGAVEYAAEIIPLVEDYGLDTIWLGMRVLGHGRSLGATRSSEVELSATALDGPGDLVAYLTESFGEPRVYVNSRDGVHADGDVAILPPGAHTHMSWVFTEAGVYHLSMRARLRVNPGGPPVGLGEARFTFAVGVDPRAAPGAEVRDVLAGGHADIAVDIDRGRLVLRADPAEGGGDGPVLLDPATTVVEVPNKALAEIPGDPRFRFLGEPGDPVYQLPQAVLGRHVHGEIDPHLWHDVRNAISYVELIRDTLVEVDPAGAATYRRNASAYIRELEALDEEVRRTLGAVPEQRRRLVTTHDAFRYLGRAYGVDIAGFVTPNPAIEPSLTDRRRLADTLRNLEIPAVFLEPNLRARSSMLMAVAAELGVDVCPIYGDTFGGPVNSYIEMMRFNARSLHECLNRS